jgi:XTP/dITP diphosphohydrolase
VKLLIATRNAGKVAEFREIFDETGLEIVGLDDADVPGDFEPEETGRTFRDNACLKATAYARKAGTFALADDSGLAVDALDGQPGVVSARFASLHGAGVGDEANNAYLLRRLAGVLPARRTARFVCLLALADPQGRVLHTAYGRVEGTILHEPRGEGGFGYDPLFLHESGRTTAEMTPAEKHAVSHRGQASSRLRGLLDRHGIGPGS